MTQGNNLPLDIKVKLLLDRDYQPIEVLETTPKLPEEKADQFRGLPSHFEDKGVIYELHSNIIQPNGGPQLNYRCLTYRISENLSLKDVLF